MSFFGFLPNTASKSKEGNPPRLGMFVDHSSIDENSNPIRQRFLEKNQSRLQLRDKKGKSNPNVISLINCSKDGKGARSTSFIASDVSSEEVISSRSLNDITPRKGKKNRRKIRWRVGTLKKQKQKQKPKPPPQKPIRVQKVDSSTRSFHTLHSSETQIATNNKTKPNSIASSKYHSDKIRAAMMNKQKYTTIENNFSALDYREGNFLADNPIKKPAQLRGRNPLPRRKKLHPSAARHRPSVSPSGTSTTASSSISPMSTPHSKFSSTSKIDHIDCVSEDETDRGTVIAIQAEEELEGHRTVGLLRHGNRSKNKRSDLSSPTITEEYKSKCQANTLSSHRALTNNALGVSNADNSDATALRNFDDDSEDGSGGGILWKLAELQAISEGYNSPPQRILEKKSSASSINPEERERLRMMQSERNLKAMHDLAARHLYHKEYDEAIEVFEEILRGQQEIHGENHHRVGTALHNIATVHMRAMNFAKAIQICQKAILIRGKTLGSQHPDLAVSFSQLGIAYLEMNEHKAALRAFREALAIRRKILKRNDPRIARLLNNIGCSLFELGQLTDAEVAFEEALCAQRAIMRRAAPYYLAKGTNNINNLLLAIAATLCNLASIQFRWKMHDKAIVALEEALLIQQSVLGEHHCVVLKTKDSINSLEQKKNKGYAWNASLKKSFQKMEYIREPDFSSQCGLKFGNLSDMISDVMSLTIDDILISPLESAQCIDENKFKSILIRMEEDIDEESEQEDDLNWI